MVASLLLSSFLLAASTTSPCAGTYDRTDECEGPTHVLLEGTAEDVPAAVEYDETPVEMDSSLIGWQLAAVAGATAIGAGALHVGQLFYALHRARLVEDGALTPKTAAEVEQMQAALGYGAIGMWLATALIGGTGATFFVFDPKDGALKLSIMGD